MLNPSAYLQKRPDRVLCLGNCEFAICHINLNGLRPINKDYSFYCAQMRPSSRWIPFQISFECLRRNCVHKKRRLAHHWCAFRLPLELSIIHRNLVKPFSLSYFLIYVDYTVVTTACCNRIRRFWLADEIGLIIPNGLSIRFFNNIQSFFQKNLH